MAGATYAARTARTSSWIAASVVALCLAAPGSAVAERPRFPAAVAAPATQSALAGMAVLAQSDATDAAWPLAQALYADPLLRPALDEATARVLAGERPSPGAAPRLVDLAATREAVRGDDAPSRRLLASLARDLGVAAIVVVTASKDGPTARVFLASSGQLDAAVLLPDTPPADAAERARTWTGAVGLLRQRLPARSEERPASPRRDPADPPRDQGTVLSSPWLWGAVIAAGIVGGFVLVATRGGGGDAASTSVDIHARVAR